MLCSGKIFHGYHNNSKNNDYPWSWDEKPFQVELSQLINSVFIIFDFFALLKMYKTNGYVAMLSILTL